MNIFPFKLSLNLNIRLSVQRSEMTSSFKHIVNVRRSMTFINAVLDVVLQDNTEVCKLPLKFNFMVARL